MWKYIRRWHKWVQFLLPILHYQSFPSRWEIVALLSKQTTLLSRLNKRSLPRIPVYLHLSSSWFSHSLNTNTLLLTQKCNCFCRANILLKNFIAIAERFSAALFTAILSDSLDGHTWCCLYIDKVKWKGFVDHLGEIGRSYILCYLFNFQYLEHLRGKQVFLRHFWGWIVRIEVRETCDLKFRLSK